MRNMQTAAGGTHGALLALLLIHIGYGCVVFSVPGCRACVLVVE